MLFITLIIGLIISTSLLTTAYVVYYKNYCKYVDTHDTVPYRKYFIMGMILLPDMILLSLLMQPMYSFSILVLFSMVAYKQAKFEVTNANNDQ